MKPATISLLLPTHGRPDELRQTLRSVSETCARPSEIELLIYAARDDEPTKDAIPWCDELVLGPHTGYRGLPRAINALAAQARGDWLFVFADDVGCDTPDWDDIIRQYDHTVPTLLTCANDRSNPLWFPIISRPAYEAMGVVTLSQFHDVWLDRVFQQARGPMHQGIPAHFTDRLVAPASLQHLSPHERHAFDFGIHHAAELLRDAIEKGQPA